MAGQDRTATDALALLQALSAEPYRFGFLQTLRMLEQLHKDKPRIGRSRRPVDDPVRFAQEPTLAFATSELVKLHPATDAHPPVLDGVFFGLFGPNGPLPLHLTQYARDRQRNSDDWTFRRFADIFHHRMLGLHYRAWADAQPAVSMDRPEEDDYAIYIGALFGIGQPALQHRDALPDHAKLCRAGRFAQQSRPAEGLRDLIADYFGVEVSIHQFAGEWLDLPEDAYWRLGNGFRLGEESTIGARVFSSQHKFRIELGPLSYADFRRFLPGSESPVRLAAMVRMYVNTELNWDLNLVLRADEVPPLVLGRQGELGRTCWLNQDERATNACDAVLDPTHWPAGPAAAAAVY